MSLTGKSGARHQLRARLGLEVLEDRTVLSGSPIGPTLDLAPPSDDVLHIAMIPNDPHFGSLWGMNNTSNQTADINAPQAWDVTRGSMRTVVAVMDTGIDYTHPDLYLNIWINQKEIPADIRARLIDVDGDGLITFRDLNDSRNIGPGKIRDLDGDGRITAADILRPVSQGGWATGWDNAGNGFVDDLIGWNFVDNNNNPMDTHGHGTHIAGTIGAMGNNGIGVAGINHFVQMMPIRFLSGDGRGEISQYVAGLNYAVDMDAKVSNNSWVGGGSSESLNNAINNARAKGHIVVAAAGNSGTDNDTQPSYPASYSQDNVIAVAAIDRHGSLASYSNFGRNTVNVAAPGSDIYSTALGGGYRHNTGTSMAAPHVTGVIALVWSRNPTWTYRQVLTQIENTATRTPALDGKVKTGLVNAAAAVGVAQISSTAPRIINAVNLGNSTTSISTFRVTFDRVMNPNTVLVSDVQVIGPGGRVIPVSSVVPAPAYGNRVFDIVLSSTQTQAGTYTLRIGPNIADSTGQRMTAQHQATFTIQAVTVAPPRIVNAVNLGGSTTSISTIRVSFDRPMNPATFTTGLVSFVSPDGRAVPISSVTAARGYNNNVYDIELATPQTRGGTYTLRINAGVRDTSGLSASEFTTTFALQQVITDAPTVVNAVNLGGSTTSISTIRVSFNQPMTPSTFLVSDVVVIGPDGRTIPVSAVEAPRGYNNNVYDVILSTPQTLGGTYTLRVGPTIRNASGVLMASVGVRSIAIAGSTPTPPPPSAPTTTNVPTVVNTVNLGGSTTEISTFRVSFNQSMNPSTFLVRDVVVTGPDGRNIAVSAVRAATGYNNNVYDVILSSPQRMGGTYTLRIGPDITSASGIKMASASVRTLSIQGTTAPPPVSTTVPTVVNSVNLGGSTTSMSTIRVSFNQSMMPSTFLVSDVVVTGPDGRNIAVSAVRAATGYNNNVYDIVLSSTQTMGGTYTLRIGPNIRSASGVLMTSVSVRSLVLQGGTQLPPVTQPAMITYTSTSAVTVAPLGRGVSTITINDNFRIADLNVRLNISTPRTSDLYIHLQAPDGTNIVLVNRKGGFTANFVNTILDDQASTPVGFGFGPFTGTYKPEVELSYLNGKSAQGTWKLWVVDRVGGHTHTIQNFSLMITRA